MTSVAISARFSTGPGQVGVVEIAERPGHRATHIHSGNGFRLSGNGLGSKMASDGHLPPLPQGALSIGPRRVGGQPSRAREDDRFLRNGFGDTRNMYSNAWAATSDPLAVSGFVRNCPADRIAGSDRNHQSLDWIRAGLAFRAARSANLWATLSFSASV